MFNTSETLRHAAMTAFQWFSGTSLYQDVLKPHPIKSVAVLAAALVVLNILARTARAAMQRYLGKNRHIVQARRTAEYLSNKLVAQEHTLHIHDRKQFKKFDPREPNALPEQIFGSVAWAWCYNQYVARLMDEDLEKTLQAAKGEPWLIKHEIRKLFQNAKRNIPGMCHITVILPHPTKTGKIKDQSRFPLRPDEILDRAGPDGAAVKLAIAQDFRCPVCDRDLDDGIQMGLDKASNRALCRDCLDKENE